MDHYHQTTPPTRLKSEVLGAAGSRKGATIDTVTFLPPRFGFVFAAAPDAGMGECDAPLDFARVQQALEGGGR